ncbi:MAG: sulfite exporter TauE/SafE family protein [Balneolaceae bacterium]
MWWAYAGALFIGISLGLLGSGGATLTVPLLVYLVGEPEKLAIAESLGIVGIISVIGSLPYIRNKEIHFVSLFYFGIPGMIGAYSGAGLSRFLSGNTQLLIFSVVLLISATMMIRNSGKNIESKAVNPSRLLLIIEGLAVGHLTGLVGVGGGFLIVPTLVLLVGLPMRVAVGTSLMIVAWQSFAGFYKYLDVLAELDLQINWHIILAFTSIGILGSFAGNKIGTKISQQNLKRGFGYFLVLMGLFILYKSALE